MATESGYTDCTCCSETIVVDNCREPNLCPGCEDAGCDIDGEHPDDQCPAYCPECGERDCSHDR